MITAIELNTEWQHLLLDAVALGPLTGDPYRGEPMDTIPKRLVAESLLHFTLDLYEYLASEGIECASYCPLEARLHQSIHVSVGTPPTKVDACYICLAIEPRLAVLGRTGLALCHPLTGGEGCTDIEGMMHLIRREQGIINRYHRLHEGRPSCGGCHYISMQGDRRSPDWKEGGFCGQGQDTYAGGCDQHQRWDSEE
jgi:hypothetical protein